MLKWKITILLPDYQPWKRRLNTGGNWSLLKVFLSIPKSCSYLKSQPLKSAKPYFCQDIPIIVFSYLFLLSSSSIKICHFSFVCLFYFIWMINDHYEPAVVLLCFFLKCLDNIRQEVEVMNILEGLTHSLSMPFNIMSCQAVDAGQWILTESDEHKLVFLFISLIRRIF